MDKPLILVVEDDRAVRSLVTTTLDTHDGIGIVDVKDLMTDEEIHETKEAMFTKGANVKKIYNTAAYNNLDHYCLINS